MGADMSVLAHVEGGAWTVRWDEHPALSPAHLLGIADANQEIIDAAVKVCGRHGDAWEALDTDEPAQLAHACDVLRKVAGHVADELAALPWSVVDTLPPRASLALRLLFPRNSVRGNSDNVDEDGGDRGSMHDSSDDDNDHSNTDVNVELESPEYLATLLLLGELEARINALDEAVGQHEEETETTESSQYVRPGSFVVHASLHLCSSERICVIFLGRGRDARVFV